MAPLAPFLRPRAFLGFSALLGSAFLRSSAFLSRCGRGGLRGLLFLEDWILPPACAGCARRRWRSLPLCRACLRALRDSRPEDDEAISGLPWARALFRLTPPLHALIHGFKYRYQRRHVAWLCAWLRWREAWRLDLPRTYDALVPVPLHPARRRERGYNQSEALARGLARASGVAVRADLLARVRFTATQTRLRRGARAANLEGAFRAGKGGQRGAATGVEGLRLLLVDDVCTTGSTLTQCREELLRAGATRVDALVLAWVEHKIEPGPVDLETAAGFFA